MSWISLFGIGLIIKDEIHWRSQRSLPCHDMGDAARYEAKLRDSGLDQKAAKKAKEDAICNGMFPPQSWKKEDFDRWPEFRELYRDYYNKKFGEGTQK